MKRFGMAVLFPAWLAAWVAGCGGEGAAAREDGAADVARGVAAQEAGDLRGAAAAFGAAAAACGTNFEARARLAAVNLALGDAKGAGDAAAAAVALCPESAEARLLRGQAAYRAREYRKAHDDFAAVAGAKELPAALRSAAWAACGVAEMAEKSYDAARLSFLRALRLDRRNAAAWYHQGRLLHEVFRFHEAAAEQFTMAAGCPDVPAERAKKIRGEILPALAKASAAATAKALGTGGRDAAAAAKLVEEGVKLEKKKMAAAAVKKYEAAFAADRSCEAAAKKVAALLPQVDKSSGATDRALEAYRALIALRPSRLSNYLEAALLAYQNRRWAVAAQIMDRAVAFHPENDKALGLLVASLKKAGKAQLKEAWGDYRAELQ